MKKIILIVLFANLLNGSALEENKKECKNNNATSCFKVGLELVSGKNAEDQELKALGLDYIRKACIYGDDKACDWQGENYFKDTHYKASIPFLKQSCKRKIKSACEALGTIYRDGLDVRQNDVVSREYYQQACELKSGNSCINVSLIYRGGFGVKKNREKEKLYYKKACDNGIKVGCNNYTKMDNKDKGIAEPSIWEKIKGVFN